MVSSLVTAMEREDFRPMGDAEHEPRTVEVWAGLALLDADLAVPRHARGLVVFAHGSGSSRHSPRNRYVATVLNEGGLATLLLDLLTPDEEREDAATAHLRFDIGLLAERLGADIFNGPGGPIAYQNLFWFFGHPAVYIMFFPFLGITAEVVSTFSRKRFFGYKPLILALLAFTGLSMSVWAHHMFTTGQVTNKYFSLTSTALVVPAGMEYFAIIATMIGGAILLRTPMLFALGFFLQFLIGGLTGVFSAAVSLTITRWFFVSDRRQ